MKQAAEIKHELSVRVLKYPAKVGIKMHALGLRIHLSCLFQCFLL